MASNRRAGVIFVKVDGGLIEAKGNFTYNMGQPMREAMVGATKVDGFKETPQVSFIEGELTDSQPLDIINLIQGDELTVTLELNNGKTIVLSNAWFAGDGQGQTEEANITVRWESAEPADEMR